MGLTGTHYSRCRGPCCLTPGTTRRSGDRCVQDVGKVITKEDRCIAFPNFYQHLVSPFRLADPTRPGHRKILVFFLVDPCFMIPSASVVAPQQGSWIERAVAGTTLWERLPVELQDIVMDHVNFMTLEQAKVYRKELMAERTAFVETVDGQRFGYQFNMWYVSFWVYATPCLFTDLSAASINHRQHTTTSSYDRLPGLSVSFPQSCGTCTLRHNIMNELSLYDGVGGSMHKTTCREKIGCGLWRAAVSISTDTYIIDNQWAVMGA